MATVTSTWLRTIASLMGAALIAGGAVDAAYAADAEHSFEIYGFAQGDYIQDLSGRLDPNWDDAFRPSKIDTSDVFGTNGQASISVKQSRFGVKGTMPTGSATPITFKFEFDLFGTGVDAGQTTFRLRHMYGEWGSVLVGQTNSLFMDGDVFPNTIDYWGPTGMVFLRLPQIRWTAYRDDKSQFAIALEKPGNDVDPGNVRLAEGYENSQIQNDEKVPDLTAQYHYQSDWGHFQVAGILRRVGYEYRATTIEPWKKGSDTGWGINLGGTINTVGKDKVLLQAVYGDAIASYMNDGGMDLAPQLVTPAPNLKVTGKAVALTGIVAYYDHYWSEMWSSSIGYSFTEVDNTNYQATNAFHKGDYASVNLLAYPAKNVMVGAEFLWGKRTNNDGSSGDDTRLQFSVKYNFSSKP